MLFDINHSNILFDPPPRIMTIKTQLNQWDLRKLKIFCTAKDTVQQTKRQQGAWEKTFANDPSNKGLLSKTCKPLLQLHNNHNKTSHSKPGQKT